MLNEGRVVIREDGKLADKEDNLLNMEAEIEKFISTVMITMKTQEDSEGFDFLTGLPMRNRGEKLAAQFMQQDSGYLVFLCLLYTSIVYRSHARLTVHPAVII